MNANTYLPPTLVTPGSLIILAISNTNPMVVLIEPSVENTYQTQQLVRLTIPSDYGMSQASNQTYQILAASSSSIILDVDSTNFDTFNVPSGNVSQPASLAPAGSKNLPYSNFTHNVPFQSLNNIGN